VSEKPASSSFKDRIAAFNKSAAPPIAPFKPGGLSSGGGSGFIKKPFVAPPPSRNAYVAPPKDVVPTTKLYRRDEDPEIKEREAENTENAAKAGLVGSQDDQDEDQPKPTSLKERIALLQKQQAEAANRHADAAAKKEKPKRPPKKRTDSEGPQEGPMTGAPDAPPPLERRVTESMDDTQTQPPRQPLPTRRKSSKGAPVDGNEADMSGAGETTEGPEDLTEREDSDAPPKPLVRVPTAASTGHKEAEVVDDGDAEEEEEEEDEEMGEAPEEEDDDEDPEARRKEELRARMAKMSVGMGGMGMMGMHNPFASPMGSGGSAGASKKKPPPVERRPSEQPEEATSPRMAAPPIPVPGMMALPGMGPKKIKEEEPVEDSESDAEEESTPVSATTARGAAPERK
jgi:hypothetical protein